jgi:putative restriction endonuclease
MNREEIKERLSGVTVWKKGDRRAPHKPLLLLYLLGRVLQGKSNSVSFEEVDENVGRLLEQFGPPNKTQALYPFWFLQNDGFWELQGIKREENQPLGNPPPKTTLLKKKTRGSLAPEVYEELKSNPDLAQDIAGSILQAHFPASLHEDILQEVGIGALVPQAGFKEDEARRRRDPAFREMVLRAYGFRCAVCGFDVRLGSKPVGIEAAHVKWHQAGGPDIESNGLALCSLHHKLFDRGVFTLNDDRILVVSENATGTAGFEEWLMQYHGKPIRKPVRLSYNPHTDYTGWHIREVFRGRPREFRLE